MHFEWMVEQWKEEDSNNHFDDPGDDVGVASSSCTVQLKPNVRGRREDIMD